MLRGQNPESEVLAHVFCRFCSWPVAPCPAEATPVALGRVVQRPKSGWHCPPRDSRTSLASRSELRCGRKPAGNRARSCGENAGEKHF